MTNPLAPSTPASWPGDQLALPLLVIQVLSAPLPFADPSGHPPNEPSTTFSTSHHLPDLKSVNPCQLSVNHK